MLHDSSEHEQQMHKSNMLNYNYFDMYEVLWNALWHTVSVSFTTSSTRLMFIISYSNAALIFHILHSEQTSLMLLKSFHDYIWSKLRPYCKRRNVGLLSLWSHLQLFFASGKFTLIHFPIWVTYFLTLTCFKSVNKIPTDPQVSSFLEIRTIWQYYRSKEKNHDVSHFNCNCVAYMNTVGCAL